MGKNKGGKPSGGGGPTNGPYHWGNGPQPKGKGCAVTALALAGGIVGLITAVGYGVAQAVL